MQQTLLNGMHHTPDAGYRSGNRQGRLKGARKDVLLQIKQWLTDETDRQIFWLDGLAGTGKTTIAQTFAEISFADGELGAGFFVRVILRLGATYRPSSRHSPSSSHTDTQSSKNSYSKS